MEKLGLQHVFEEVRVALPDIVGDMQPLGHGHFGIAVGNEAAVKKILYRPDNDADTEKSLRMFAREAEILQAFVGRDLEGIEIPILIKPVEMVDHEKFMATYSMGRIKGHTNLMMPADEVSAATYPEKYENAGAFVAKFHRSVKGMDLGDAIPMGPLNGTRITLLPFLDDKTNAELLKADQYLQANMWAGNIHGDINLRNIIERDGKPTGLIDFSHTGHVKNAMAEFWLVPWQYSNEFIKGYEDASGENVAMMACATSLSMWTQMSHNSEHMDGMRGKIQDALRKMAPVLG